MYHNTLFRMNFCGYLELFLVECSLLHVVLELGLGLDLVSGW